MEQPKDVPAPLALGVGLIDLTLGGGLALGATHELRGMDASLYATMIAVLAGGPVLWCSSNRNTGRSGDVIYPPGLMGLGLDPAWILQIEARNDKDMLWAAHEALRTGAVRTVITELRRGIDLAGARKLQLAAEAGGGLGLFLGAAAGSSDTAPLVPAAITRWQVNCRDAATTGSRNRKTALHLSLTRNRRGALGQWDLLWAPHVEAKRGLQQTTYKRGKTMEQNHATHHFTLVSQTGNQSLHAHQAAMA